MTVSDSQMNAMNSGKVLLIILALATFSFGQQPKTQSTPTLIYNKESKEMSVAVRNNLYCAGFIQKAPINTSFEIVGAEKEYEQRIYSQGNFVYVNQGSNNGVKVGDMYSVVRPRGKFDSKFSKKNGLGFYVQEVGAVEIVKVKDNVSVARVKTSCDNFLFGDLLQPMETRTSSLFKNRPALDIFGEPTGKSTGRIVLARDGREAVTRDDIVYIDLGQEDNVQAGDYLTIYRPLGKGGPINYVQNETISGSRSDYESEAYKGGKYSNQAPRKSGSEAEGKIVTTNDAKSRRPANLRNIVGEMVILNVKERTATALITRTAQEIHTGDMVEIQ
jgi:hypothetical protein